MPSFENCSLLSLPRLPHLLKCLAIPLNRRRVQVCLDQLVDRAIWLHFISHVVPVNGVRFKMDALGVRAVTLVHLLLELVLPVGLKTE